MGYLANFAQGNMGNAATQLAGGAAQDGVAGTDTLAAISQGQNNPAMQLMQQGAQGQFLNANPYIDETFNRAADQVTENYLTNVIPQTDMNSIASGRFGSGAWQRRRSDADENYMDTLGGLANDIYGQNYANERQNMLQSQNMLANTFDNQQGQRLSAANALGQNQLGALNLYGQLGQSDLQNQLGAMQNIGDLYDRERTNQMRSMMFAPEMAAADYNDINALMGIGSNIDARNQALANQATQDWNFEQQLPFAWLGNYMNAISGNYGSTTTSTNPAAYGQRRIW